MMPCGGYAPNRLDPNENGPPVLFNSLHPDGIKNENGKLLHGAELTLRHGQIAVDLAKAVDSHHGKIIIEQPVNHGKDSQWPIKGRELHSTFFDTTIFKNFSNQVEGDFVYADLCMVGASSKKTTAHFCNQAALPAMTKYFGGLMYHGDASELTPLKGRKPNGDFMTKGSEEYSPLHCKLLAMALLEDSDVKGEGAEPNKPCACLHHPRHICRQTSTGLTCSCKTHPYPPRLITTTQPSTPPSKNRQLLPPTPPITLAGPNTTLSLPAAHCSRGAQLSEAALNHHAAVMVGIFIAIDAATPLMMPIIAAAKAGLALPAANTERNVGLRDV